MRRVRYILISILLLLPSALLSSKEALPTLPSDPAISRGSLPNGVSYFFVKNQAPKGVLDIAILQRACQKPVEVPTAFLSRYGIAPGEKGYVEQRDGNLIYRFRNIQTSIGEAPLDSLYYLAFRMIEASAETGEPGYGTTDQTLIVSGDIDKATLLTKLKMLSMMIPLQNGPEITYDYIWNPENRFYSTVSDDSATGLSTIRFNYRTPALARELNSTAVNVVSYQMDRVLGSVMEGAIQRNFDNEGLNLRGLHTNYQRSDISGSDNIYWMDITVPSNEVEKAKKLAHRVFDTIANTDFSSDQFMWANEKVDMADWVKAQKPVSNEEYVNRCICAVLNNASLATDLTKASLFRNRDLPDSARVHHFNRFTDNIISAVDALDSIEVMDDSSEIGSIHLMSFSMNDTLGFVAPQEKKMKVKPSKADTVTGGNYLYFDNGFTILYKQLATNGIVYFSWIFKGGDPVAPIESGNVGSLSGDSFLALMDANGIHMEFTSSTRDVCLRGYAPSDKQQLLAKSLITLFQSRPELGCAKNSLLVMVGDRTEYSVQKYWQMFVGDFNMSAPARKKTVLEESWKLQEENENVIYSRLLSIEYTKSSENYFAARVCDKVLEDKLTEALDGTGLYADVESGFTASSVDKFNIYIRISGIEGAENLPSPSQTRNIIRSVLKDLATNDCNVTRAKTAVINEVELEQAQPEYKLKAARQRFSESKDFTSKYKDKVGAVTPATIRSIFAKMVDLGTVEYLK